MATILVVALLSFSPVDALAPQSPSGGQVIGDGVTVESATAIADLYARPEAFVGTRVRVDGVVTAVCEAMGCWMALAPEGAPDRTVRLKAEHDGGLVFPVAARGKAASAEGVFERIAPGDTEAANAAAEQAAAGTASDFAATYHIKATGAVIR